MANGAIEKEIETTIEMVLMGNYPRHQPKKLPKWVTKKPMISDVQNLTTATMNHNKHHYKWSTSCNYGDSAWGYHWKVDHRECK